MRFVRLVICESLVLGICLIPASAQNTVDNHQDPPVSNQGSGKGSVAGSVTQTSPPGAQGANDSQLHSGDPFEVLPPVRIGPGDDLEINVFGLPELTQHLRVSNSGEVSLPLIGKLHLAGLSSDEAQAVIEKRLADGNFVKNPNVALYVKEYTTEGITVTGEVNRTGVYSALAGHRLLDLIETAGGLTPRAGKTVTISHRTDAKYPIVVNLSNDLDTGSSNIELVPGDRVVVSKAGIVYVVGEVNRPGGFVMEGNKITASQALAMAAGPTHSAALNRAKIVRRTSDGLQDVALPLQKIMKAKTPDIQLQPEDIIWVPASKGNGLLPASSIIGVLTTLAIYRF